MRAGERWALPDIARGVAIVAMLIAHAQLVVPRRPAAVTEVMARLNDVASPLFALVMGMAAAIVLARSPRPRSFLMRQLFRAVVLIVVGVWLETWGSWVAVVLAILGCLLIVGAPLLLLGPRTMAIIAVVTLVSAPALNSAVQQIVDWPGGYYAHVSNSPHLGELLVRWLVADPHYRVTSLVPFFLAGALLVRCGYARRPPADWSLAAVLLGTGMELVATWWRQTSATPVSSGSWPDTWHDVALVLVAMGACGLLADLPSAGLRVLTPLRELGIVALSVYVAQVGLIAWLQGRIELPVTANDLVSWSLIVFGVAAAGWAWAHFLGRGPVERLMDLVPVGRAAARPDARPS